MGRVYDFLNSSINCQPHSAIVSVQSNCIGMNMKENIQKIINTLQFPMLWHVAF